MSWIPQPQTPSGMAERPVSQDKAQRGMAKPSSSPVVVDSVCRKCLPWPPPPLPHSQSEDSSPTETAPKMSQTCLLDAAAHHKLCLHAYLHETTPPPRPAILPSSWCPFSSREPSVPTSLSILCVCVSVCLALVSIPLPLSPVCPWDRGRTQQSSTLKRDLNKRVDTGFRGTLIGQRREGSCRSRLIHAEEVVREKKEGNKKKQRRKEQKGL